MDFQSWFLPLGLIVVIAPAVLTAVLSLPALINRPLGESTTARLTQVAVVIGLVASSLILILMLTTGRRDIPIDWGSWVHLEEHDFHFNVLFRFDRLSVPFVILTFVLCGTISAFASKYLHREPGYVRFFILFSFFQLGMVTASLASTIETLFAGWELVGLSSALLVAFFQERVSPVRNGLRVWVVYRVADAAFLVAAVALHHMTGKGDIFKLMGETSWPFGHVTLTGQQAFFVGFLLLVAAAGKSALIPFSGWLPRAMEGPTPSSAVFYGALSVHLGAFLLLRFSPIIEASLALQVLTVVLGLSSSFLAASAARVQTDIKSALSFASLTQVGLIIAEIGLGLYYLALAHIIGHACLRTLQLLRAPSLLRDYSSLENALGRHLPIENNGDDSKRVAWRQIWYRWAFDRGFLDSMLQRWFVEPFLAMFRQFDRWERRWTDLLSGGESRESDRVGAHVDSLEDLA